MVVAAAAANHRRRPPSKLTRYFTLFGVLLRHIASPSGPPKELPGGAELQSLLSENITAGIAGDEAGADSFAGAGGGGGPPPVEGPFISPEELAEWLGKKGGPSLRFEGVAFGVYCRGFA